MLELKDKTSVRHISSFFLEIILVVFFFAISCAILIQVFGKAYNQNAQADKINTAVVKGQTFNEYFSTDGDLKKAISGAFGEKSADKLNDTSIELSFDNDWNITSDNAFYKVTIKENYEKIDSGTLSYADIKIENKDKTLFSTVSSSYIPSEEGSHE